MRYFDQEEAKKLNAEPWMTELLKMNPDSTLFAPCCTNGCKAVGCPNL